MDTGVSCAKKPHNPTLFWEMDNGDLILVPHTDRSQLVVSDDKGENFDSVDTGDFNNGVIQRTNDIYCAYDDRANDKLYFIEWELNQALTIFYLDLTDYTLTTVGADIGDTDYVAHDIWVRDGNLEVLTTDDNAAELDLEVWRWNDPNWDLIDDNPATFVNNGAHVTFGLTIGTVVYFYGKLDAAQPRFAKFDGADITELVAWAGDEEMPPVIEKQYLHYDGTDLIYFVMNKAATVTLAAYSITGDSITVLEEYGLILQLARNNRGVIPSENIKGYDETTRILYEFKPKGNGVVLLSDVSNRVGHIRGITDNFFISDKNGDYDVYEYVDVSEQMDNLVHMGGPLPVLKQGSFQSDKRYEAYWRDKDSIKVYDDNGALEIWGKIKNKYQAINEIFHYDIDFYSNELAKVSYDKTYTNNKTSEKLIDIIDNKCNFCYQSSSIVATATQYDYVYRRVLMYMFSLARWLEREILYVEPDCKVWSRAYDTLTATGKSWTLYDGNQNAKLVDIENMALDQGGYIQGNIGITRATVRYINNTIATMPVATTRDPIEQTTGIISAKEYPDAKIADATTAQQLATNRYTIGASDIQFIGLRVEGEGFLQEGKTIEIQNLGAIAITQADFTILRYRRYPKQDVTYMVLSDNIIFPSEFNSYMDATGIMIHAANLQTFENQAAIAAGPNNYILLQDQKPNTTGPGGFTQGAWRTRVLNTEVTDQPSACTLAANQFTLIAGTYIILATAPSWNVDRVKLRLQNITDASTALLGTNSYAGDAGVSVLSGLFTIAAAKAFELQHYCQTTKGDGLGLAMSFGVTEIYAEVQLWKVS